MKRILVLTTALAGLVAAAHAGSILSDDFNYPDGAIVGAAGSPWLANSGTPGTMTVTNAQLFVAGTSTRSEDIAGPLLNGPYKTNGTVPAVYAKFTLKCLAEPSVTGTYFAHFSGEGTAPSLSLHRGRVWISSTNVAAGTVAAPGQFFLGIANSSSGNATNGQWPTALDTNVTYTVVVRYVIATATSTLWVNPDTESGGVTATDVVTPANLVNAAYYAFRQATGQGTNLVDDLRVGTSFSDVAGANTAPTISSIPNQSIPRGGTTGPLPFTVGDAESNPSTLTVTPGSTNTALVPLSGIVVNDGDGTNRTVTVTPPSDQQGTTLITLTVSDGVNTAQSAFRVTVGAPAISSIPNQIAVSNTPIPAVPFTVVDAEGDTLTPSASSSNPTLLQSANITFSGTGDSRTITLLPEPNQTGVTTVTISFSDGTNTTSTSFALTVRPVLGLVFSDAFAYTSFPIVPDALYQAEGSPWATASGTAYQVQVTNGWVYLNHTNSEDVEAALTNAPYYSSNAVVFYTSFTVNFSLLPSSAGNYFLHLKDANGGTTFRAKVFASTAGASTGAFRLGVANSGNTPAQLFPQDLSLNTAYTVVTRYNSATGETVLWVDPRAEQSSNVAATDAPSTSTIGSIGLRQVSGIGDLAIGPLKVGTSFSDVFQSVAPAPEPVQVQVVDGKLVLSWTHPTFALAAATSVAGPYLPIIGATSPFTNDMVGDTEFFRLVYP